jgi:hypothetical protein
MGACQCASSLTMLTTAPGSSSVAPPTTLQMAALSPSIAYLNSIQDLLRWRTYLWAGTRGETGQERHGTESRNSRKVTSEAA